MSSSEYKLHHSTNYTKNDPGRLIPIIPFVLGHGSTPLILVWPSKKRQLTFIHCDIFICAFLVSMKWILAQNEIDHWFSLVSKPQSSITPSKGS